MLQVTASHPISHCRRLVGPVLLIALQIIAALSPVQDAAVLQKRAIERIERCAAHLRKTGNLQSILDEMRQAEDELSRSHQEFVDRQDLANAALSLNKMAALQRWQSRWQQAKSLDQQANDLARRANHRGYQVKSLIGQARVAYVGLKDYDAAIQYLDEAIRLGDQGVEKRDLFDLYDLKSSALSSRGEMAAAFDYAGRSFSLASEMNDAQSLFYAYFSRGGIYQSLGLSCNDKRGARHCLEALDQAKNALERAMQIAQKEGYDYLAQNLVTMLKVNNMRRTIAQMNDSLSQAILKSLVLNPTKPSDVYSNEEFFPPQDPFPPEQEEFIREAINRFIEEAGSYYNQAILSYSHGEAAAALANFRKAVEKLEADRRKLNDESGRSAFIEDKMALFYDPIMLLLQLRNYPDAFELLERSRSRVLADLMQTQEIKFSQPSDRAFFAETVRLNARISQLQKELIHLRTIGGDQNASRIANIGKEIQLLEDEYQKHIGKMANSGSKLRELIVSRPVSLADFQLLMKREGFETLSYISRDGQVVLWHTSSDAIHARSILLPREHLNNKIAALRRSLKDPKMNFDEKTARELFLFLIQPALPWIKSERLVIIPHDDLHYIPFQALIDPSTGRALGERFAISYAPSATVLQRLKKSESIQSGRLLAVADPSIVEAKHEVEAIGKLYPNRSRILSDTLVKEDELKRSVAGNDLIHLSVHGKFNAQEPLLSHLELRRGESDDGNLTAAEMFGLPLQNARLVVLSACETGQAQATRANEVVGMVRALLYAGANNLVLSSWKVDAASTALWMETFYREAQTKTPAEAARAALTAVKRHPDYSHPYYWSPFLLIGR
jgi:CHAT domain-containing protein